MSTNNGIVAVAPGAVKAKIGNAHVHPTQPSGRDEQMRQTYIVQDDKIVSEGAELDMYKA